MNLQLCHSLQNFPKEAPTGNRAVTSSGSSFSRAAARRRRGEVPTGRAGVGNTATGTAGQAATSPTRDTRILRPGHRGRGECAMQIHSLLYLRFNKYEYWSIFYLSSLDGLMVAFQELINMTFLCVSSDHLSSLGCCL